MRIMIFGRPGSGKSTYAVQLGGCLSLPVYHVDKIFFESNWKKRQREEFLGYMQGWIDEADWIIDGNSMSVLESRFATTDIALYFCPSWYVCFWRIFKRLWHRDPRIDDRNHNTPERVTWELIKYMVQFRKRYDAKIYDLVQRYPAVRFVEVNKIHVDVDLVEALIHPPCQ